MRKVRVGVIGCGNISGIYFENLQNTFLNTEVVACADARQEAAKAAAEERQIKAMTVEELLHSAEVEIVVNLTTPQSHYDICKRALLAGKHVYVEKPLSLSLADGKELVRLAEEKGLMLGCAPDTFLGGGIQTCKKLIDSDFIGQPIGATAFMMCHGHESWHPSPEFYYQKGGGPMFDMGPYYLTALCALMGGVKEVCGMTATTFPTRTVTSQPKFGTVVEVEVPTYVSGTLRFETGAVGNIITTFDVWNSTLPRIEIYGTKGTLMVPDPNGFGGPVLFSTLDGCGFKEVPLTHGYAENSRGVGVADMAQCILDGRTDNRANGKNAAHVLEIMCAVHTASDSKATYSMTTPYQVAAPMPTGLAKGLVK